MSKRGKTQLTAHDQDVFLKSKVPGETWPKETQCMVYDKDDNFVAKTHNTPGRHAEKHALDVMKDVAGPVTLRQNYSPCNDCANEIKQSCTEKGNCDQTKVHFPSLYRTEGEVGRENRCLGIDSVSPARERADKDAADQLQKIIGSHEDDLVEGFKKLSSK